MIERPQSIIVSYYNLEVTDDYNINNYKLTYVKNKSLDDINSRIIQHEYDHILGLKFNNKYISKEPLSNILKDYSTFLSFKNKHIDNFLF